MNKKKRVKMEDRLLLLDDGVTVYMHGFLGFFLSYLFYTNIFS